MDRPLIAVSFPADRDRLARVIGDAARVELLDGLADDQRARVLSGADVLFAANWSAELRAGEARALNVRFIQLRPAGADHLPFDELPPGAIVAGNVGAYAGPMAEHAVAMTLSLLKRLPQRHTSLAVGAWDERPTRAANGSVCGILGFGGIGKATARLMRGLGMRIHVVNTSGRTDELVDFAGTLDDIESVLAASDVLVIALPLTRRTRGLIGARELGLMKSEAVLINLARGAIIDQAALYDHLRTHMDFSAGIDAWWAEPNDTGGFRLHHPFFQLPNLLGSPHNSAIVPGILDVAMDRAAENILRFLRGEPVTGVVRVEDYVDSAVVRPA